MKGISAPTTPCFFHSSAAVFVVAVTAISLSGCETFFGEKGYFRDRGDDYLKAEVVTPIKLPESSSGARIGQLFAIPSIEDSSARLPEEFTVPRPASSDKIVEQGSEIKIQKLGERRWIDINNPPGEVWPGVRSFLAERGMGIAGQDPSAGIIETVWLSPKEAANEKDRYRIQLEPGLRVNSTEIHVIQMTANNVATDDRRMGWPAQSMNADREVWMVRELAASLAKVDATQASMLAQAIGSNDQRVVLRSNPEPLLVMRVDYARAWASVAGALNSDGFHVDNANREQGLWQVTYSSVAAPEQDDSTDSESSSSVWHRIAKIVDFGSSEEAVAKGTDSYRVLLQQQDSESVHVIVRDNSGQSLPKPDAERLLRRIKANLL